jgi:hypothetical protein
MDVDELVDFGDRIEWKEIDIYVERLRTDYQ